MSGETVGFDADEVAESDDGDFELGMADLGLGSEDDFIEDDDVEFGFDGTEDAAGPVGGDGQADDSSGDSDERDIAIEDALNNGLGRAAVYGLPEGSEKEELNDEFTEIAEAFHVGFFGERVAQEYLSNDLEDIPPELGLAAASLAFAAVVIYRRPDGEYLVQKARWKVQDVREGYRDKKADDDTDDDTEDSE